MESNIGEGEITKAFNRRDSKQEKPSPPTPMPSAKVMPVPSRRKSATLKWAFACGRPASHLEYFPVTVTLFALYDSQCQPVDSIRCFCKTSIRSSCLYVNRSSIYVRHIVLSKIHLKCATLAVSLLVSRKRSTILVSKPLSPVQTEVK